MTPIKHNRLKFPILDQSSSNRTLVKTIFQPIKAVEIFTESLIGVVSSLKKVYDIKFGLIMKIVNNDYLPEILAKMMNFFFAKLGYVRIIKMCLQKASIISYNIW